MQFKKFKSLASTHIKKSILLLVISSMSALMLCSCGDSEKSATEEDSQEATTAESTTEQTELENQDKDPTEATTQGTTQQTTQGTTQSTHVECIACIQKIRDKKD